MKILIAEDDPVSRRIIEAQLIRWGYEVVMARDGQGALDALQAENAPRLALIDWGMPGMDGVEVCRLIRAQEALRYVYAILITSRSGKESLVQGMEAGADDYIVKPYDPPELRVRLRAARRILDLQDALLAKQEVLRRQATHDPLTGLWNHAAILEILERETGRAGREKRPLGVIMADIDHFKKVNDTYGHIAGDCILRAVAEGISRSLRTYDSVGRYGGEEFLGVLPSCSKQITLEIAQRIRAAIAESPFDTSEGIIPVTISLGLAIYDEGQETSSETLIRKADKALYQAKEKGRNRIEIAEEEDTESENRQVHTSRASNNLSQGRGMPGPCTQ